MKKIWHKGPLGGPRVTKVVFALHCSLPLTLSGNLLFLTCVCVSLFSDFASSIGFMSSDEATPTGLLMTQRYIFWLFGSTAWLALFLWT